MTDAAALRSEIPRIVKVYEDWWAVQPPPEPVPWPQTDEEVAAYVDEIASETPATRLLLEHVRGTYPDVSSKASL